MTVTNFWFLWHGQNYQCDCGQRAVVMVDGGFYCYRHAVDAFGQEFIDWWESDDV